MMMNHILRRKNLFTSSPSRCFSSFPPLLQQLSGFSSSPSRSADANVSDASSDLDASAAGSTTPPFLTAVEIEQAYLAGKIPGPCPIVTAPSGSLSIIPWNTENDETEEDSDDDSASDSDYDSEFAVTVDRLVMKAVTYLIEFNEIEIETMLTNRASVVDKWIMKVSSTLAPGSVIGIGCDLGPAKILHFCVDNKCLIYHMAHKDIAPLMLEDFLQKYNFVGVGMKRVIPKIAMYGMGEFNVIDVAKLAKKKWPDRYDSPPELHSLAKDLGIKKSVDVKRPCIWKSDELTTAQIENACLDAYISFKLGKELV